MADRLRNAVVAGDSREAIREKRLVLVSPFDPAAGFNVGNAMQRNKLIYGLADAALVVNSDHEKGGTWSGAIEQIERFHACPVFVRTGEGIPIGNRKLIEAGACPWPNPTTAGDLTTLLANARLMGSVMLGSEQEELLPGLRIGEERMTTPSARLAAPSRDVSMPTPAKELLDAVRAILVRALTKPLTQKEVAELLGVQSKQASTWLNALVEQRALTKMKRPTRYVASRSQTNGG